MKDLWTIHVDRDRCIGSGMCVALAPDRFTFEERFSRPADQPIEQDDRVRDAVSSCPMEAITITRPGTADEIEVT